MKTASIDQLKDGLFAVKLEKDYGIPLVVKCTSMGHVMRVIAEFFGEVKGE